MRELLAYPDVPEIEGEFDEALPANEPLMTVRMMKGNLRLSYFSLLTTFGTPHDALLEELRIKTFFPAVESSAALFQCLA